MTHFVAKSISGFVCIGFLFAGPAVADEDASPAMSVARAAELKNWNTVSALLANNAQLSPQPDGMTALHWAVRHQHMSAVNRLLKAGADVNAVTAYGITPLHIACTLQDPAFVQRLLNSEADVQIAQPGRVTPLMTAARTGIAESVSLLIQYQADPDVTERRGQTALMWAAAAGNTEAVEVLISAGAGISAATQTGFTPMMFAARNGHLSVVELLYKAGVDVSAVMKPKKGGGRTPRKGTSALTLAVESGHFELAMLLVRCGADPNDQRSGLTPLHSLAIVRKPNRGEDPNGDPPPRGSGNLTSLQFVRDLVAAGADVNVRLNGGRSGRAVLSHKGATPFLFAGKTADLPYMQLLLELGADPMLANTDGCHALMAAAGVGVRAVGEEAGTEPEVLNAIEFLVSIGLDVNTVDDNGETAMHGAAYRNFPDVVDSLVRHGAASQHWNHKNKWGWTPVMIAQGHRPGSFKPSPVTVAALQRALEQ